MKEDILGFKNCRSAILLYLDPQYQKIEQAARNMTEFVKEVKRSAGHWSVFNRNHYKPNSFPQNHSYALKPTEALIYLEDYYATLIRQTDLSIKLNIRRQKNHYKGNFESIYSRKVDERSHGCI